MYLDGKRLQWCWAHLKRDIQKLIESPDGQVRRLGQDLMRQERLLFEHWRRYRAGEITWRGFQSLAGPIRGQFNGLLLRGSFSGNAKLIEFCDEILPRKDHLWTFLKVEGIEPTNNTAERTLRPAVIYRKLNFGTQSSKRQSIPRTHLDCFGDVSPSPETSGTGATGGPVGTDGTGGTSGGLGGDSARQSPIKLGKRAMDPVTRIKKNTAIAM